MASSSSSSDLPPSSSAPSAPASDSPTSISSTPAPTSATPTPTSDTQTATSDTSASTSDVPSSTSTMASSPSSTSEISPTSDMPPSTTTTSTSDPPPTTTTTPPPTTTTTTTSDTTSDTPPPTTTTTTTSDTPPPTTTTTTSTPTTTSTTTSSSDPPPTTTTTSTTSDPSTTSSDDPTTTSTSTTTTVPSPSPTPSPSPPPATTQIIPTTTFKTTVFISTTNERGSPTSTAPPNITSTFTTQGTDGGFVTVTQVIANPSLIPNDSRTKDSGFFGNTGAVAAVFVLVGLAATSIAIWTIFAIRRRRRLSRIEHQTADAATTPRPPLEDDDDPQQQHFSPLALQMSRQRSSPGLTSTSLGPRGSYHDDPDHPDPYNPYAEFGHIPLGPVPTNASNGYSIARTSSPPNAHLNNDRSQRASAAVSLASGPDGHIVGTHSTTPSGASIEPLLASYRRQSTGSSLLPGEPVATVVPPTVVLPRTPPIGSSQLLVDVLEPLEVRSAFTTDDRLDPGLQQRQREAESASMRDLRDEEDYTRPVLGVRNLP